MKKNSAFTLIELTVIIFIVGLMGLYVLPNIGDRLFHTQTKLSLRRIAGNIKEVFNLAATKKQTYSFVIDIDKDRYWVFAKPNGNGETSQEAPKRIIDIDLSNKIDFVDVATAEEKFSQGEQPIDFTPRGLSGKYLIHIRNNDTDYTLIISRLTGQVKISNGYIEYSASGEEVVSTYKKENIKRERVPRNARVN